MVILKISHNSDFAISCGQRDPMVSPTLFYYRMELKLREFNATFRKESWIATFETEQDKMFFLLKYS